jgi:hypothetical protein
MSQRRIRQARANLLWGLGVFALLQLGLAIAIECWLPQLRDPYFGEKLVRLLRRRNASPRRALTVVMLGSSRTFYGLKASRLEGRLTAELGQPAVCFNFGLSGAGPVLELLTLKRLLAQGIRPDLLFVEVLPPLLGARVPLREVEAESIPTDHLWWYDLPLVERYGAPGRKGLRREWWQAWPFPWYTRRVAILNQLAPSLVPWDRRLDWMRSVEPSGDLEANWETWSPARRRRVLAASQEAWAEYLKDFSLDSPACQSLCELLAVCRRERIPAALVLMPEGPEFRRWYPPGAWEQLQTYLDGLSREWAVPIINAREWLAEEDFLDSHHMLAHGASRFTERFGQQVLLPLVHELNGPADQRLAEVGPEPGDPLR